ncbi:HAD family hydrolase [Psychroflexus lacisalsi]|uniref:HAD family hydrolase n=1 Tax=Psychroflexus lacisalsi TaxID=503928 RepID=A0ABN1K0V3_9FLAO|nr:HAD family hydrolase [Psychroflexus lacisalsi]MBZ9620716.1 HAD family hydrolase [Psychroflexus lacisalsi]
MSKDNVYIFDLDDTLFPTATIRKDVGLPLLNKLKEINYSERYFEKSMIEVIYNDCWKNSFVELIDKYNLPNVFINGLHRAYKELEVTHKLKLYKDAEIIKELNEDKYLVTTGYEKLQKSKVQSLGIESYFKEIFVNDSIEKFKLGKLFFFNKIFKKYNIKPDSFIVIGDNVNSEIKAGNKLSFTTVLIDRNTLVEDSLANFNISSLEEILFLNNAYE